MERQAWLDEHSENRAAAFERLLGPELLRNYRLESAILGNPVDAEDATHDAVVQAWRSHGSLRDGAKFSAWFGRIVVNVCRRRLASRWKSIFDDTLAVPGPSGRVTEHVALDGALARLSPDHRSVVTLRYLDDLTTTQIAERTGVRVVTVKSRFHYALSALRAAYEGEARPHEDPIR